MPTLPPQFGFGRYVVKAFVAGYFRSMTLLQPVLHRQKWWGWEEEGTQEKEDKEKRKYVCEHIVYYLDSK